MVIRASILLCAMLGACHGISATAPDEAADVEGRIIGRLEDGRALVEATFRTDAYADTFYVNSAGAIVLRRADGSVRDGDRSDLVVGYHLRAWLTGVELQSLPPQYPAWFIEVIVREP